MFARLWRNLMPKAKKNEAGDVLKSLKMEIPDWQYAQIAAAARRSGKALTLYLLDVVMEDAVRSAKAAEKAAERQAFHVDVGNVPTEQATQALQEMKRQFNARGEVQPPPVSLPVVPTQAERVVEALTSPETPRVDPRETAHPCMAFRAETPANFRASEVAGSCVRKNGGPCHYNISLARSCAIFYPKPAAR